MNILGIETSCDECAAAVVRDGSEILSSTVFSQIDQHARFGGVVPEVASRSHLETIRPVIEEAIHRSGVGLDGLDAVAVTQRPGLIGSLLVGLSAAKGLALARGLPFIPVDHVQAHVYACIMGLKRETEDLYPLAALVVSGGHTTLFRVDSPLDLEPVGRTLDDAAGEAFDKVSAILGLGYPGGPALQNAAATGDPKAYPLPRPLPRGREGLDFSFSGLKTAVLYRCRGRDRAPPKGTGVPSEAPCDLDDPQAVADMAASFQAAAVDVLVKRLFQAVERVGARAAALGGGVAANALLRERAGREAKRRGIPLLLSPRDLATDNAAMIAGLAWHLHRSGRTFGLDIDAAAR